MKAPTPYKVGFYDVPQRGVVVVLSGKRGDDKNLIIAAVDAKTRDTEYGGMATELSEEALVETMQFLAKSCNHHKELIGAVERLMELHVENINKTDWADPEKSKEIAAVRECRQTLWNIDKWVPIEVVVKK